MNRYGPDYHDDPRQEAPDSLYPPFETISLSEEQQEINRRGIENVSRALELARASVRGVDLESIQQALDDIYRKLLLERFKVEEIMEEASEEVSEGSSAKYIELKRLIEVSETNKGFVVNLLKQKIKDAYEAKEINQDEVVALVQLLDNQKHQTVKDEKDFRERQHND